jgi:glutathione S-transferase
MGLTVYGSPRSRSMRVLWIAEELRLDYEHVPLAFDDDALKNHKFLAINPAGAVPTIVDGDLTLSESLAITMYLDKAHGQDGETPLYPRDAGAEAQVWRWSLWAQQHLEPWVQNDKLPTPLRDAIDAHAGPLIKHSLGVLEKTLTERAWLAGARFTVADLNVAGVLSPSRAIKLDLSTFPATVDWLGRCYSRPAAIVIRQRFQA